MNEAQPMVNIGCVGNVSHGKCLGRGELVLMADGDVRRVEEIVVGDVLVGDDSRARIVVSTTCGRSPLYRIRPARTGLPGQIEDGYVCNDQHLLVLRLTGPHVVRRPNIRSHPVHYPVLGSDELAPFELKAFKCSIPRHESKADDVMEAASTVRQPKSAFLENIEHPFTWTVEAHRAFSLAVGTQRKHSRSSGTDGFVRCPNYCVGFRAAVPQFPLGYDFDGLVTESFVHIKALPEERATAEEIAWWFGAWLGGGLTRHNTVICASEDENPEIIAEFNRLATRLGLVCRPEPTSKANRTRRFNFTDQSGRRKQETPCNVAENNNNVLCVLARRLGMWHNKIIPLYLLGASRSVRMHLLAGLIDTDGHYQRDSDRMVIIQKSEQLASRIVQLARSLGCRVTITEKWVTMEKGVTKPRRYHRIFISGERIQKIPCRVSAKRAERKAGKRPRNEMHYNIEVASLGNGDYYGFELRELPEDVNVRDFIEQRDRGIFDYTRLIKKDGTGRFLLGDYTVTHNSSMVRCITGEQTARLDSRCTKNNITVQVGYSNAKIYRCDDCMPPECYASCEGSCKEIPRCKSCGFACDNMTLVSHVSFVDAPGHHALMRNMISGSAVMDGAILVVAANEACPQPQTAEHLVASDITGIERYILVQNKVDLLVMQHSNEGAQNELETHHRQMQAFVEGTSAENAPIVPASFSPATPCNVDVLLQYIATKFKQTPEPAEYYRPYPLIMHCVRSFDINKPGTEVEQLKGGVIGGTIMNGTLKIGDEIEIRPGLITLDEKTGQMVARPLRTRVVGLMTGKTRLKEASRGGLIAVATTLDPTLTRADRMVGMCVGHYDQLPETGIVWTVHVRLLRYALGMAAEIDEKGKKLSKDQRKTRVKSVEKNEILQIAVGSGSEKCKVLKKVDKNVYKVKMAKPVCPIPGQPMTLSRSIKGAFRIIGQAQLVTK